MIAAAAIRAASFTHIDGHAACFGTRASQTCNHSAGNDYTVNGFSNMTQMNGYNAHPGSQ